MLTATVSTAASGAPLAGIETVGKNLRIRTGDTVSFTVERNTASEVVVFLPATEVGTMPPLQSTALGDVQVQAAAGGVRLTYKPRLLISTFQVVAVPVGGAQTIEIQASSTAQLPPTPASPPVPSTVAKAGSAERVSLKVRDGDVKDTLTLLGRVAKANVVTESSVTGRVSLNLNNVTFDDALQAVAAASNLTINRTDGDVYIVSQVPKTGGFTSLPVTGPIGSSGADPKDRPVSINVKNAELSSVIENISNQSGAQIIIKGGQITERVSGRFSGVGYEEALSNILAGTRFGFARQGKTYLIADASPGLPSSRALEATEVIVLAYTPVKDVPALLPGNLTQSIKADKSRNAMVVTGTQALRNQVRQLLKDIDQPLKQVVFEVKIVELTEDGSRVFDPLRSTFSGTTVGTSNDAPLSLAGQLGPQSSFGTLNDVARVLQVVSGLITQGKGRLLTDTKLNTVSSQKASINVQTDINIVLQTLTTVNNATTNNTQVSTIRAGTVVEIEPFVQADGNVFAQLKIESSIPGTQATPNTPPNVSRRQVTNTMLMKDGQTIEIGGLIQNNNTETIQRFPILGYLPLVGQLFSNTSVQVQQRELVVFITPRIRDVQPAAGARLPLDPPR